MDDEARWFQPGDADLQSLLARLLAPSSYLPHSSPKSTPDRGNCPTFNGSLAGTVALRADPSFATGWGGMAASYTLAASIRNVSPGTLVRYRSDVPLLVATIVICITDIPRFLGESLK